EYSSHKVLALPHVNGKLEAQTVREWVERFYADGNHEHMVFPGMVYISHPTEYGTLYSKAELEELSAVCRRYDMPLFLDGARLAYGLASKETDVTLPDIARLCDVFYIGGTKCGALCGEAVVFTKNNRPDQFLALKKQRGALLAKGRLLGVQFDALFTDDLYFRIGEYAIEKAEELKAIFEKHRIEIYLPSPTNQQFIILSNERAEKLQDTVSVSFWEELNETHTIFRLATNWSTTEEDLKALDDALGAL
ncbi:MAG: threonine aldolase family protein, partial [Eubacteriales bacterium]